MIVGVDCGNSAVKAAILDGPRVGPLARIDDDPGGPPEEALRALLATLVAEATEPPTEVLAVSVVDRWTDALERLAASHSIPVTIVAPERVPIRSAVLRVDQTGPDRILGAWAGSSLYGAPAIIVDLGTATTVDAVDPDGVHLGGAILPGPAVAAQAMADHAPRLPLIRLEEPAAAIGIDTVSALLSGIVIGHVGAVRELVTRMRSDLEDVPSRAGLRGAARVIVTGGHARAPWARRGLLESAGPGLPAVADVIDPDLLLKGLGLLAERRRVGAGAARR